MPERVYAGCVGVSKNILNGIGKLSKVSTTNVCRRDRDVLLNTLEDELHTRVPLLLEKKTYINITTIYVKSTGQLTNICILALLITSIKLMHFHIQQYHVIYQTNNYSSQGCALRKIFREPLGSPTFQLGNPGLKDGRQSKIFGEILAGVPRPPSWLPKLINQ